MDQTLTGAPHARNQLSASSLACRRGDRRVFSGLAFELTDGGLLLVTGANGTGKTSLLRVICGFLHPEAGKIEWNGSGLRILGDDYIRNLAYVGHMNAIKDDLSVLENLRFAAQLAGLTSNRSEIFQALGRFAFGGFEDLPCKFLSQGQKRRLALARLSLSASRALWVLDEPFAALDAAGIETVRELLEAHLSRGGMALVTTHQDVPVAARTVQRLELAS